MNRILKKEKFTQMNFVKFREDENAIPRTAVRASEKRERFNLPCGGKYERFCRREQIDERTLDRFYRFFSVRRKKRNLYFCSRGFIGERFTVDGSDQIDVFVFGDGFSEKNGCHK